MPELDRIDGCSRASTGSLAAGRSASVVLGRGCEERPAGGEHVGELHDLADNE